MKGKRRRVKFTNRFKKRDESKGLSRKEILQKEREKTEFMEWHSKLIKQVNNLVAQGEPKKALNVLIVEQRSVMAENYSSPEKYYFLAAKAQELDSLIARLIKEHNIKIK